MRVFGNLNTREGNNCAPSFVFITRTQAHPPLPASEKETCERNNKMNNMLEKVFAMAVALTVSSFSLNTLIV